MTSVDYSRIEYPKVRSFIVHYNLVDNIGFENLKSKCFKSDEAGFRHHIKHFQFDAPLEKVWRTYKFISPQKLWRGNMIRFGVQYARKTELVTYADDSHHSGIEAGQILILNLRLINGLFHLAVGHEIKEVNDKDHLIRICYLESGASHGSQFIRLSSTHNGSTVVTHETYYKSNSWFRDILLYPYLHTKAITEFHNSVKQNLLD